MSWLNVPLDTPVSELLARGRRARAIEALRERLLGRLAPSPEVRLQLVDLLVEAGRSSEAAPILLGLADEFAKDGFVAKAIAALKRIDTIQPGRSDVEDRLARLVHQQHEAAPVAETPEAPTRIEPEPEAEPEIELEALDTLLEVAPPAAVEPSAGFRSAARRFLAPLSPEESEPSTLPPEAAVVVSEPAQSEPSEISEQVFEHQLLDIAADIVHRTPQPRPAATPADRGRLVQYAERLLASALFRGFTEEELLAVVHDLGLLCLEAGEIVVAEGEKSEGLFILVIGGVKVFVRSPTGRNVEVACLAEGQFFGEIASLSGRSRSATVTATTHTELLVLDASALRSLTTRHPGVGRILEDAYVERASNPDVAAVRSVRLADPTLRRRGDDVLASHFGQSRWEPRMKMRLSELLLKTGKEDDAVAVLVGLADDFTREGFPEKAVAVLKKIERIRNRNLEELSLAPLPRVEAEEAEMTPAAVIATPLPSARPRIATDDFFQSWVVDILRDRVHQIALAQPVEGYRSCLKASPLFRGLGEDELLAVIRGLRLVSAEPGDMLVTEGEPGESVFIVAAGSVRVFVGGKGGSPLRPLGTLGEGSFFGEIGALQRRPRSATVVAASRSELLELDRAALDRVAATHPRVRQVLEDVAASRSSARASLADQR